MCGDGKEAYRPPKTADELYARCVELRKEIDEMKAKEQDRMKNAVEKMKASNGTELMEDCFR